jgi:hypothetical protein
MCSKVLTNESLELVHIQTFVKSLPYHYIQLGSGECSGTETWSKHLGTFFTVEYKKSEKK